MLANDSNHDEQQRRLGSRNWDVAQPAPVPWATKPFAPSPDPAKGRAMTLRLLALHRAVA